MSSPLTFFASDAWMLEHKNDYDPEHFEAPIRLKCILDIVEKEGVLAECQLLESKKASIDDLQLVHSRAYIEKIQSTEKMTLEQLEGFSSNYEAVYVNNHTWEASLLAAGCALEVMQNVLNNPVSNGFAAVRPPGHHAAYEEACGFCIFSNIAICAKKARKLGVKRVLIVDWDVHAGQGTQYSIKDDPEGIKLVSIHRFEEGKYWPKLPESAAVHPYPNTINVPLNKLGYGDADYAAYINLLVLPIIEEWRPELILVSCGFDAALGDQTGLMAMGPGGYGWMTGTLAGLGIPLCLLLEGGYFVESISKGALYAIKALLKREPPEINSDVLDRPCPTILHTLLSTAAIHCSEFPLLDQWLRVVNRIREKRGLSHISVPHDEYKGKRNVNYPYVTRGLHKPMSKEQIDSCSNRLHELVAKYALPSNKNPPLSLEISRSGVSFGNSEGKRVHFDVRNRLQMGVLYFFVFRLLALTHKIDINRSRRLVVQSFEDFLGVVKYRSGITFVEGIDQLDENFTDGIEGVMELSETLKHFVLFA